MATSRTRFPPSIFDESPDPYYPEDMEAFCLDLRCGANDFFGHASHLYCAAPVTGKAAQVNPQSTLSFLFIAIGTTEGCCGHERVRARGMAKDTGSSDVPLQGLRHWFASAAAEI